jgi:predicted nucleic acid-binding protein
VLLVDTNVLLAAADVSAVEHDRCARLLEEHQDLTVTAAVAVESAWMIESRLGPRAEAAFVAALAAGELHVVDLTTADWRRCAELIERYHDLGLGVVDSSIVAVAERLGASTIATLNHRDFAVVRPVHVAAFELLP